MFCVQNNLAYFMHCPLVANQMARWSIAKVCFQNAKRVYIREIYVTNFGVIIISFLREFEKSFSTNLAGMCRCIEFDNCPVAWKSNLFLHLAGKFVVERDWFYRQCPSHKLKSKIDGACIKWLVCENDVKKMKKVLNGFDFKICWLIIFNWLMFSRKMKYCILIKVHQMGYMLKYLMGIFYLKIVLGIGPTKEKESWFLGLMGSFYILLETMNIFDNLSTNWLEINCGFVYLDIKLILNKVLR